MAVQAKNKIAWIVVDDVIQMLYNLEDNNYTSMFEEPTMKYYKHLHDAYGAKILLAVFYCTGYNTTTKTHTRDLTSVSDKHKAEFIANSDWLKLSFHCWAFNNRYRNGFDTVVGGYDFGRDMIADYGVLKTEAIRIAGVETWTENTVNHFYDGRKNELDYLATQGTDLMTGFAMQNSDRGECGYLSLTQQKELADEGYYHDPSNGILYCLRDFTSERINGTLKVVDTPNRVIDFLDYNNHRAKKFMNAGTHEVQITNGISNQHPVKRDLHDFCSWCNERGYTWKFPVKTDFNL